jgi:UDP-N-acetylmuramate--alanine ligase
MAYQKVRVGIIFGGQSKEREISFAGGRTVYDNLNKSIFETIPVFVDSFGNFIELNWEFIYKGTIRDFYPPVDFLPSQSHFQYYAENLGNLTLEQQQELIKSIGKKISLQELKEKIEFAFLCLHGPYGEDGRIQGLLEYFQIPYSGSGILPSAIGIDKSLQKQLMVDKGFNSPKFITVPRNHYISGMCKNIVQDIQQKVGFPCVIKPAHQGSSIGVSIIEKAEEYAVMTAIEKALFTHWMDALEWKQKSEEEKINFIKKLTDIREGIGMPVLVSIFPDNTSLTDEKTIYNPDELLIFFNEQLSSGGMMLQSMDGESSVLIEGFIEGKEFSCIVVEHENGTPIALPPTEIRKGKELFDYRSKYLPGLSRKITPIDLPDEQIEAIRKECERLFIELKFDVYARIDGFLGKDGKIFLNDPNTTSGMMPSSFFFHQAAEIGLNPSQFLTFIISTSLRKRIEQAKGSDVYKELQLKMESLIHKESSAASFKTKVAVILGGYSSERHISVESGRNVFEKLSSSEKYFPMPVFLTGSGAKHELYQIPINLLLKDNADDIKEKIYAYKVHPLIEKIKKQCASIIKKYSNNSLTAPVAHTYESLAKEVSEVFIALHGRPGEDGAVQENLDRVGLSYNGSNKDSSSITIDKYRTNEILKQHGYLVAEHALISEEEWAKNKTAVKELLEKTIHYPLIAKPVDDGCSSAVKKIKSFEEFEAFATLMFRTSEELDKAAADILHIKEKEEFPQKRVILVEELISRKEAIHFLEITGGMLTHFNEKGEMEYEVFEASEALADGDILSLEEKFLAGQGQNITPARYAKNKASRDKISEQVKQALGGAAKVLGVTGYCRIDAFVRVFENDKAEVIFIEVNSLPGMTPATCIFHQAAINHYKPYEFIDKILDFGVKRNHLAKA